MEVRLSKKTKDLAEQRYALPGIFQRVPGPRVQALKSCSAVAAYQA